MTTMRASLPGAFACMMFFAFSSLLMLAAAETTEEIAARIAEQVAQKVVQNANPSGWDSDFSNNLFTDLGP